jgi:hypothetical protein
MRSNRTTTKVGQQVLNGGKFDGVGLRHASRRAKGGGAGLDLLGKG